MLANMAVALARIIPWPQLTPVQPERAVQPLDQTTVVREQVVRVWIELHRKWDSCSDIQF